MVYFDEFKAHLRFSEDNTPMYYPWTKDLKAKRGTKVYSDMCSFKTFGIVLVRILNVLL